MDGARGGYFFFLSAAIKRPMMPIMTRLYVNKSEYVTIAQPPFPEIRGQEAPPLRGDRPPTAVSSAER